MKIVLPLLLSLVACTAMAADQDSRTPPKPPREMSAEMKAALDSCRESGKPGDSAFESCMAEQGFARPERPIQGREDREEEEDVTAD